MARGGDIEARLELDNVPDLPPLGAHLWSVFLGLHATRASSGMGPGPLSRAEVRLWEEDECQPLDLWERRAIFAIDAAWLKSLTP